MIRRFAHLLVVTALLAGIGGHWAILQSVAWVTMLADNLQTASVTEAVSNTFDGEHPCPMCKQIAAGKKSERKSDAPNLKAKKLEFANGSIAILLFAPVDFRLLSSIQVSTTSYSSGPPVPPPRHTTV